MLRHSEINTIPNNSFGFVKVQLELNIEVKTPNHFINIKNIINIHTIELILSQYYRFMYHNNNNYNNLLACSSHSLKEKHFKHLTRKIKHKHYIYSGTPL